MTREIAEAMQEDNPVSSTKTLDEAIDDLKI
jgi:hypothetical protein